MASMIRSRCSTPLILAIVCFSTMIRAAEPFEFDSPKNWRAERIAFPLGFAPELKHSGFEELRFAPGMFNPKSNTYWTYVFFWWIEGEVTIDRTQMERDLKNYYLGLSKTVGRSRKLVIDPEKISAQLKPAKDQPAKESAPIFTGTLKTYDAFATGDLLELNVEISKRYFPDLKRTCYFFALSPKPISAPAWTEMRAIRNSFKIRKP
ncbi:MAG: hypothetical protein ACI9OD_000551 [Limisphaerales bacterium]|jgi:hypothetical protein